MTQTVWQQPDIINWSQLLLNSYEKLLGHEMIDRKGSIKEQAEALFFAPFVVVSHGTEADPIFNYGNQTALNLFEITWEDFTKMPSSKSAEVEIQAERKQILEQVAQQNFITNYEGVRISSTLKRFLIQQVTVWNLINTENRYCGQAAIYSKYKYL